MADLYCIGGHQLPDQHTYHKSLVAYSLSSSSGPIYGQYSIYKGEPAFCTPRQELLAMAEPYKNSLVGRFAVGHPSMDIIRKFVVFFGMKGDHFIGFLDHRHVLLSPGLEEVSHAFSVDKPSTSTIFL